MELGLRVPLPESVWNLFGGVLTEWRFLLKSNPEDADTRTRMLACRSNELLEWYHRGEPIPENRLPKKA
jgi:hypothetical protein